MVMCRAFKIGIVISKIYSETDRQIDVYKVST